MQKGDFLASPFLVKAMFLENLKKEALIHKIEYINMIPLIHENYKSVIVALLPYYAGEYYSCLSRYARGLDYHTTGRKILNSILEPLAKKYPFAYHIYVDVSPLNERELALKAGLGVLGKNNLLINEKYGSYCFIATAVTNREAETEPLPIRHCIGCGACIRHCPGKAIREDGVDYQRCLSRINQEKRISPEQEAFVGRQEILWGCDVCQTVCPYNRQAKISPIPDFTRELLLNVSGIEQLTNRTFREKYGKYAFAYKGKAIVERNWKLIKKKDEKDGNSPDGQKPQTAAKDD